MITGDMLTMEDFKGEYNAPHTQKNQTDMIELQTAIC